ncbi:T9SS type A sorting domain-containing protein [Fibrobacter sp.]|uniref:T9SS type A sorting domain-containing protein n=1 Tax=Fibrobacter sp. TaxID=35828 RepID=UPI0025C18F0B|nr:T9SS type A sorting domain-containing protein [Fibrobacter sp.]MBR3073806.1 T9SS type A sorting domain-containing protein [Fibrobacter sp.]
MNTRFLGILVTVGLSFSAMANASTPLDIASEDSLLVDDFADGDYQSKLGKWVFMDDNGDGGGSTLKTSIVDATTNNGSAKALKLDFKLDQKELDYEPFVEAQVSLAADGSAVDLTNCSEIRYDFYGGLGRGPWIHSFRVVGDTNIVNVEYNYHHKEVLGLPMWQEAVIKWNELNQAYGWGKEASIEDVRKNAVAFSWQLQGGNQSGSFQIANVRCVNMPTYTVKFYHGKELLDSNVFVKGEYPFYRGKNIASSEKYNYEIVGWKPELKEVTADVNYQVVLDSFVRTYDVTFNDDEGYTLYRQYLEYGEVPSYAGMDPVKLPSVGYSYKFKGWGKQICEEVERKECYGYGKEGDEYCDTWTEYVCHVDYVKEFPPVTSDVRYYPVYDSTANSYTVKFADYDGKILSEKKYAFGTKASDIAKPKNPSRAKTGDVEYTFEGWTPSVSNVNGAAVYVATYSAQKKENDETVPVEIYTVVFANGDSILQIGEYDAGSMPEYKGATPTKDSTAKYVYYFTDWRDQNGWSVESVYENKVYMADFDSDYRKYWIVFLDDDGSVIDSVQYEYGDDVYAYDIKTKSREDGFGHGGWTPDFVRVTGRAVYQAVYTTFRVRFVDDDGNEVGESWTGKGQIPDCRDCSPRKKPTADFTYEFVGWNKEFTPVTDTTTYTAVFAAVPIPKATAVNIAVGDSWVIDDFEDGDEISLQGGQWFVYDDNDSFDRDSVSYKSQISKMVAVNGTAGNVLNVLYKRDCKDDGKDEEGYRYCRGWLGVGVSLAEKGKSVDLSQCNAIQYDYRGGVHSFRIESVYDKDEKYLERRFGSSEKWTTVTVYRSDLWYGSVSPDLAFTHATQMIWNDMEGEGTLELDNIKCLNKPTYTVKFYDGETLLDSAAFAQGETPKYRGETSIESIADKLSNEQYYFEFAGWTPELKPVTADAKYQTKFEKSLQTYWICFSTGKDYDCKDVEYGKTPVFEGDLTKEPDERCAKYVFDNWSSEQYSKDDDDEVVYGLQPVTSNRDYYAKYTCAEPVTYTITFLDDNGDTLSSKQYRYGEIVEWFRPESKSTAKYYYYFDEWTPSFERWVEEDRTYTAQYHSEIRSYRVEFKNYNGGYLTGYRYYPYGTLYSEIEYDGGEPERYSYDMTQYEFAGWSPALSDKDSVTGEVTFVATYKAQYAVRFVNYSDYSYSYSDVYPEGTKLSEIALPTENPTSEPVFDYELNKEITYEFAGWQPAIDENAVLTGPMTFVATFKSSENKYTVTFMDGNEILQQKEFAEGVIPEYDGSEPYKSETEEFTYTWDATDGWEPALATVTGPTVYHVKYKATRKQYEVVFQNDDGTELVRKKYDYGSTITTVPTKAQVVKDKTGDYKYSDDWCVLNYTYDYDCDDKTGECTGIQRSYPDCYDAGLKPVTRSITYVPNIQYKVAVVHNSSDTLWSGWFEYGDHLRDLKDWLEYGYHEDVQKPSSVKYDYAWNGKLDKEIADVKGGVIYTPAFDSTLRKYSVTFVDEDGTVLKEAATYDYGTKVNAIALPAKDPTKTATVDTTYTFMGWSLVAVTGDTTYKAAYKADQRKYLVKFVAEDGKTVVASASYAYETEASAIKVPTAPAKDGFRFKSWTPEIVDVTKAATYKATYIEDSKFIVTWRNEDGTLLRQDVYSEGATPKYTGSTPTKKASVDSTFTFDKWSPAVAAVTKDAEYKATYKSSVRKYKVSFVSYDGTTLESAVYPYGTLAEAIKVPEVPAKPSNEYYVYTFVGWSPAIEDVTGDVTYTALVGNKKRTYTVKFKSDDQAVWETRKYYYNEVVSLDWGPSKYTPECHYDFDKWVRTVGKSDTVKADMEYTASYSTKCQERHYEVCVNDTLRGKGFCKDDYKYGAKSSEIKFFDVADTTIDGCLYKFVGWNPEVTDVVRSVSYSAKYEKSCKVQYAVTWLNYDGKQLETAKFNPGELPKYSGATPVKESSAKFDYRFSGWTPTVAVATKDAKYTAKYDSTYRMYAVTFKDSLKHKGFVDGEMTATYRYGTKANAVQVPTIADTTIGKCTYVFSKWDKAIADVTAAATYEAIYTSNCDVPPASSSSVTSSSSVAKSSSSVAKSSSSVAKSSSSVAKSSSSVAKSSSSVAKSSSSVAKSSSSFAKSSSSVAKSSSSVAKSSSSVKVTSSATVKSSSSVKVTSSAAAKSSSSVKVTSSATAKSSSSVKATSSSAKAKSSSSVKATSSSAKAKSSSSKKTSSSSKKGSNFVMDDLRGFMKFGYENNTLTVSLTSPSMVQIHVFDMKGQLQEEFNEFVVGSREFNFDGLRRGNYVVRVTSRSVQKISRIMIK